MKPGKAPNPSLQAIDKLAELEFEFPEAGIPDDVDLPDVPELPTEVSAPEAPELPELYLPEQAMADILIPAAQLPTDIFDLG